MHTARQKTERPRDLLSRRGQSGRLDSNQRPLDPQSSALTRLRYAPSEGGNVVHLRAIASLSVSRAPGSGEAHRASDLPSPSASTQMAPDMAHGVISFGSPASTGVMGFLPVATT
jgi:hypothetical protein